MILAMPNRRPNTVAILAAFEFFFIILLWHHISNESSLYKITRGGGTGMIPYTNIPRKIWQTWDRKEGFQLSDVQEQCSRTWRDRNSGYQYAQLTTNESIAYVQKHFKDRPDIVSRFVNTKQVILQADMIRYLTLFAEGGVYSDMDTVCFRSLDLWAREMAGASKKVGMIIGVEYDQLDEENMASGYSFPIQFCQWTIASRARHPVMQIVVDDVFRKVSEVEKEKGKVRVEGDWDVLAMTGPREFTLGVLEGLSKWMGRDYTFKDFKGLTEPIMIGDIMFLNINGFASGLAHSGSQYIGNPQQLVEHKFTGTWRGKVDEKEEDKKKKDKKD